jgi:glycosyltransferase involved in cell wall biosynthesis
MRMTDPPLVSIVIPCYNHARYLGGSLKSVLAQNWPCIESIVVDDGSADDTSVVAAHGGASHVVRQTNQGLSRARNAGLAVARGTYVLFLDADDELLPDAVRSGVERHPRAGCVARRCRLMDASGRPLTVTHTELDSRDLYRELLHVNFVWTPGAALFRRDAIRAIDGFPLENPAASDYAVMLRLARNGQLIVDPRDVVRYRKHTGNMSLDAMLMLRATLAVLDREQGDLPPGYELDLVEGQRRWRAFYGEQITTALRREWRTTRRARTLIRGALFMCQFCPHEAVTHFVRKLSRVIRQLPPSELEPQIPAVQRETDLTSV